MHLRETEPLDPLKLADWLGIPIVPLTALLKHAPAPVAHFTSTDRSGFSAMTLFTGHRRTIFHNDTHSRPRQASNITHEISHGLLLHPATPPLDASGITDDDRALEEEATWLAGTVLISEASALLIVRKGWSLETAARLYGVSTAMIRFRVNVTGARRRVA
jgi:Zn-dependent peptidase ImmA (M78 family)